MAIRSSVAFLLLVAWSHPAFSQTVEVTLDGTNGFTITVHNIDLNDSIASFTMELIGGGVFDWLNNATTTPELGSNNDANKFALISVVPNTAPLIPGESWSGSGDIDGNTTAVNATITFEDQRVESFSLIDQGGNVYSTIFTDTFGPPSGSDFADMCMDSELDMGGCEFYPFATIYAYVGEVRKFAWVPDPSDMFRRDRMFYIVEVRTLPADILVESMQLTVGEEMFDWTPRTSGFYLLKAMACDPELIESGDISDLILVEHCSDWADSTNDANTPDDLPGWMVYAAIKPPSGGGIE